MRVFIDGFGKTIAKKDNQISFKENDKEIDYVPINDLKQIVIGGKGSITFDALRLLAEHDIDCVALDWRGQLDYRLSPPEKKKAFLKREQYFALLDKRSGILAKEFIKAKIKNQRSVLSTLAKSRENNEFLYSMRDKLTDLIKSLEEIKDKSSDEIRSTIFGIEGTASRDYWAGIAFVIDDKFDFLNRSGRGATDPVNAMLNYGYAVLQSDIWRTVHLAGLDPYCGFLHQDAKGGTSLVFDLMEEFRQQIVDKSVLSLINRNQITPDDFEESGAYLKIKRNPRHLLIKTIEDKLNNSIKFNNKNIKFKDIILYQGRLIGKFLIGEEKYKGFSLRW
ncbi:MAG: CRISPR-associated endonuclease Cas1 [Methanobrevibacter sp.]|jgi:CRISPR-associated protein Cas1|nr:CRISPR-associated endonuclease Cas1 [Candidatus Methanoflexus mossambicus]